MPFVIAGVLIAAVTAEVSDCNSSSSTLPHTVQVCFLNPFSVSVGSFTITHSPYVCVAQALPSPSPSSQPTAKIAVIAITAEATNSHSFFNFVVMLDFSFLYIFFARGFPLVRSEPQKVALFSSSVAPQGRLFNICVPPYACAYAAEAPTSAYLLYHETGGVCQAFKRYFFNIQKLSFFRTVDNSSEFFAFLFRRPPAKRRFAAIL